MHRRARGQEAARLQQQAGLAKLKVSAGVPLRFFEDLESRVGMALRVPCIIWEDVWKSKVLSPMHLLWL